MCQPSLSPVDCHIHAILCKCSSWKIMAYLPGYPLSFHHVWQDIVMNINLKSKVDNKLWYFQTILMIHDSNIATTGQAAWKTKRDCYQTFLKSQEELDNNICTTTLCRYGGHAGSFSMRTLHQFATKKQFKKLSAVVNFTDFASCLSQEPDNNPRGQTSV